MMSPLGRGIRTIPVSKSHLTTQVRYKGRIVKPPEVKETPMSRGEVKKIALDFLSSLGNYKAPSPEIREKVQEAKEVIRNDLKTGNLDYKKIIDYQTAIFSDQNSTSQTAIANIHGKEPGKDEIQEILVSLTRDLGNLNTTMEDLRKQIVIHMNSTPFSGEGATSKAMNQASKIQAEAAKKKMIEVENQCIVNLNAQKGFIKTMIYISEKSPSIDLNEQKELENKILEIDGKINEIGTTQASRILTNDLLRSRDQNGKFNIYLDKLHKEVKTLLVAEEINGNPLGLSAEEQKKLSPEALKLFELKQKDMSATVSNLLKSQVEIYKLEGEMKEELTNLYGMLGKPSSDYGVVSKALGRPQLNIEQIQIEITSLKNGLQTINALRKLTEILGNESITLLDVQSLEILTSDTKWEKKGEVLLRTLATIKPSSKQILSSFVLLYVAGLVLGYYVVQEIINDLKISDSNIFRDKLMKKEGEILVKTLNELGIINYPDGSEINFKEIQKGKSIQDKRLEKCDEMYNQIKQINNAPLLSDKLKIAEGIEAKIKTNKEDALELTNHEDWIDYFNKNSNISKKVIDNIDFEASPTLEALKKTIEHITHKVVTEVPPKIGLHAVGDAASIRGVIRFNHAKITELLLANANERSEVNEKLMEAIKHDIESKNAAYMSQWTSRGQLENERDNQIYAKMNAAINSNREKFNNKYVSEPAPLPQRSVDESYDEFRENFSENL